MAMFRNAQAAERCRMLVNHGMKERYYHEIIGYNYRMSSIAAAIGTEQLKKLPGFNALRKRNAGEQKKRYEREPCRRHCRKERR